MPINIYEAGSYKNIAYISNDHWELPIQMEEFEKWLNTIGSELSKGKYVADIAFDIRKYATGGGAVINANMINILSKIGMEIYLSEYPESNK
jgi:hypothetical protein